MREIKFSSMLEAFPSSGIGDGFFDAFTAQHPVRVKNQHIDWSDSWNRLVQYALNSEGPDVSEVGTTWLGSFHTMESLRPLSPEEIASLEDERHFPAGIWQTCLLGRKNLLMGIPWTMDVRVVLYRRDWLQKAGVDEATAFVDPGHFLETLQRLKAAGHPSPLGLTTSRTFTRLIHDMASWVWSAGGDLRSDDGRKMLLREPKSCAGMEAYFGLSAFIPPEVQDMAELEVVDSFLEGKTAVAVVLERAYYRIIREKSKNRAAAGVVENLGMAMLMQRPFIGGTALVVWGHSPRVEDSLRLVEHLTSIEMGQILYEHCHATPARLEAVQQTSLVKDPFYPVIKKSLQKGRSFHSGFRWGRVESRLVAVIEEMWNDLRVNPELDIAHEVKQRFSTLCDRLEQTILASSW
jgi:multiple sugar transport system substrate-binding protein